MADKAPLFLAIDVGTGSVRAAVVDGSGQVPAFEARPHEQHVPQAGWSEQSPEQWWQGVQATVRAVLDSPEVDPSRLQGICVCGQMHGPVPVADDGTVLLDRVQLWNDKRPAELVEAFSQSHDVRALAAVTGNPPAPSWIGFKVAWIKAHQPQVYDRAAAFLTPKDFINFKLTGEFATDRTEASGSYLLDCRTLGYDAGVADQLAVDIGKFPPVFGSADVIGGVSPGAATATGLPEGLPVVAGGGDFLVSLIGSGVVGPGVGSDITGTSTLISVWSDQPVIHDVVTNLCAANGGWVPFTLIDAGGDSMRWARRLLHEPDTDFDSINALAEAVPGGSEGLLFLPYLTGERLGGQANARAQFFGITSRHGKGHFYRAVMEGSAFASKRNIDIMRSAGTRFDRIVAAGGGAKGDLWLRIKASIYDMPIDVPENPEGGVLGCAALAGIGTGYYADTNDAVDRLVAIREGARPEPALVERYARLAAVFDRLYQEANQYYDTLESIGGGGKDDG